MKRQALLKHIVLAVICLVICIVTLFPFYWLAIASVKTDSELFSMPPSFVPKTFTIKNYETVWKTSSIPVFFFNTVLNGACTVSIVLILACLAAYSISRFQFKGRKTYLIFILLMQIMPFTTLIIPLYVFWGGLKLIDSRISLIATYSAIALPTAIWLLVSFMNSIPRQLDEAATIDGCTGLNVLFKIILPLLKPGLMATGFSILVWVWQEFMLSMTFINTESLKLLMAGLFTFVTAKGIRYGPLTAAGTMSVIPIVLVFLFAQKAFVNGLTAGAVKG
jgi:ABC-type glycerol-3-phosphate transport system permease component